MGAVDVHRGEQGEPALAVHPNAEVVVSQFGRDRVRQCADRFRHRHGHAEEIGGVAGAVGVVGVDGDVRHSCLRRRRRGTEHVRQYVRLRGRQVLLAQELQDSADPDALVEEPAELGVLRGRHAGVVQRHDLPLVVEHRRAGRARLGVGAVVHEPFRDVDDLVLPQRDLLLLTAGVLHDGHSLADDHGALLVGQPVGPILREVLR